MKKANNSATKVCRASGCCVPDQFGCRGCDYLEPAVEFSVVDFGAKTVYEGAGMDVKMAIRTAAEKLAAEIISKANSDNLENAIQSADCSSFYDWAECDIHVSPKKAGGSIIGLYVHGGENVVLDEEGGIPSWQPVNIVALEVPAFANLQ